MSIRKINNFWKLIICAIILLSFTAWDEAQSVNIAPTSGEVGWPILVSDDLGSSNGNRNIGQLKFGSAVITTLTPIVGSVSGYNIITDENGRYEVQFFVPNHSGGNIRIRVFGREGTFTLNGSIKLINPSSVHPGGTVTVTLAGFRYGTDEEDIVIIKAGEGIDSDGSVVDQTTETTVNTNGTRTVYSVKIGYMAFGSQDIVASQPTSADGLHPASSNTNSIFILPTLIGVSKSTAECGDTLTLTGKGFDANDVLTIQLGSGQSVDKSGEVGVLDGKILPGVFDAEFTVGDQPWRLNHNIVVTGSVSQTPTQFASAVKIEPSIELQDAQGNPKTAGRIGEEIFVKGHNFYRSGDNKENVLIDFGVTSSIASTNNINGDGTFTVSFVVNNQPVGGYLTVKARGQTSSPDAIAELLYSAPAADEIIHIAPTSGIPGIGNVVITGTGYSINTTIGKLAFQSISTTLTITEYIHGTQAAEPDTIKTDGDGKFVVKATIPDNVPAGEYAIYPTQVATDVKGEFSIVPVIEVPANQSGYKGQYFNVSGKGFGASERVEIKLGSNKVKEWTVGANGTFNLAVSDRPKIDIQPYGHKRVSVRGLTTLLSDADDLTNAERVLVLNRVADIDPNIGSIVELGDTVRIKGDGWVSNEHIEVEIYELHGIPREIKVQTTPNITGSNGTLDVSFTIPNNLGDTGILRFRVLGIIGENVEHTENSLNRTGDLLELEIGSSDEYPIASATPEGFADDVVTVRGRNLNPGNQEINYNKIKFGGVEMDIRKLDPFTGEILVDGEGEPYDYDNKIDERDDIILKEGEHEFLVQFIVPHKPGGVYQIQLGLSSLPFQLNGHITSVTTGELHVGDMVALAGTGFGNRQSVTIYFGDNSVTTALSKANGDFEAEFSIPTKPCKGLIDPDAPGQGFKKYNIRAVGVGQESEVTGPAIVGNITGIDPSFGSLNTSVTLQGNGFGANEYLTVDFDGIIVNDEDVPLTGALTNSNGEFTLSFDIPRARPAGTKVVKVSGGNSNTEAEIDFDVQGRITIDPVGGTVGTTVNVTGTGFGAGRNVTIKFGGTSDIATAAVDSETGEFTTTFVVDMQPSGPTVVTATDSGPTPDPATDETDIAIFGIVPQITNITPTSGPVGTTEITVTGDGFARNGALTIKLGTTMIAISDGDTSASANGSFTTKFIINERPYGTYNVTVQQATGESVTRNNVIEITPQITKIEINGDSDPTKKAYVGNTIKVYGNGWRTGQSIVIKFGGADVTEVNPNVFANGTFTTWFTLASQVYGVKSVTVIQSGTPELTVIADNPNRDENGMGAITVDGKITNLTPTSGTAGTQVTATGNGFLNAQTIEIGVAGNALATTVSEADGDFTAIFNMISGLPSGSIEIIAASPTLAAPTVFATDNRFVYSTPGAKRLDISPTSGPTNTRVQVTGTGYPPNNYYVGQLKFGNTFVPSYISTDSNGVFEVEFSVPKYTADSVEGTRTIDTTQIAALVPAAFTVTNNIVLTPDNGVVGSTIRVSGTGYATDDNVIITIYGHDARSNNLALAGRGSFVDPSNGDYRIRPDFTGSFEVTFKIPSVPWLEGGQDVFADGAIGKFTVKPRITSIQRAPIQTQAEGVAEIEEQLLIDEYGFTPEGVLTLKNGESLRVIGDGFGANETIHINYGSNTADVFADANGVLNTENTGDLLVSGQSYGTNKAIAIASSNSQLDYDNSFTIMPAIARSPAAGPVGTPIAFEGTGFTANKDVRIQFGTVAEIVRTTANDAGEISDEFAASAQPGGVVTITARGGSNESASTFFTIQARITEVKNETTDVTAFGVDAWDGNTIRVTGDGMGRSQQLRIDIGSTGGSLSQVIIMSGSMTDYNGSFNSTFRIGSFVTGFQKMPYGDKDIRISSASSTVTAISGVKILGRILSVNPTTGSGNILVTIEGDGFDAQDTLNVTFGGAVVSISPSITKDDGSFGGSFNIVLQADDGPVTIEVHTSSPGTSASDNSFIYSRSGNPNIIEVISGPTASVGDEVTVMGHSFPGATGIGKLLLFDPNVLDEQFHEIPMTLTVSKAGTGGWYIDGITKAIVTDGNGVFMVKFTVLGGTAYSIGGQKYLNTNTIPADTGYRGAFILAPHITINPTSGPPGTTITITGSGFKKGEPNKKIQFQQIPLVNQPDPADDRPDYRELGDLVEADDYGAFTVTRTIPTDDGGSDAGEHWVRIEDTVVNPGTYVEASDKFKIVNSAQIVSVSPASGPVGTNVNVICSGFVANEKYSVKFGDTDLINPDDLDSQPADENGEVEFTFNVDIQPAGAKTITVTGTEGDKQTATETFTITGSITALSPSSGPKGTTVTVTGTGYKANETITVGFGTTYSVKTGQAFNNGVFSITFQTPDHPFGFATVTVRGSTETQTASFNVDSAIRVNPSQGTVGSNVQVSGSGFVANERLRVKLGDQPEQNPNANYLGSFSTSFYISDQSSHDNPKTVIVDSSNNAADREATFTLLPKLISSTSGAYYQSISVTGTGFHRDATVDLKIGGVIAIDGENIDVADNGRFQQTIKVPVVPVGQTKLRAEASVGLDAEINFFVSGGTTLTVKDDTGMVIDTGYVGMTIKISSSTYAFNYNEEVEILFDNEVVTTVAADSTGRLNDVPLSVPTHPGGWRTITARGRTSGRIQQALFRIEPRVNTFSPAEAKVGMTVLVGGDGMDESDTLTVRFGEPSNLETVNLSSQSVSANGVFSFSFKIPDRTYSGVDIPTQIQVTGTQSGLSTGVVPFVTLIERCILGDVSDDGEVTAYDASLVLRAVIGDIELPDEENYPCLILDYADVSGDGTISALDAALILQYAVGLINTFPAAGVASPAEGVGGRNPPPSRSERSLSRSVAEGGIVCLIPNSEFRNPKSVTVPINVDDVVNILAGSFTLNYNPAMLKLIDVSTASLTKDYTLVYNDREGQLRIAFSGVENHTGTGNLVNLKFEVLEELSESTTTPIVFERAQLNELPVSAHGGFVKLIPDTIALLPNYPNPFNPDTWIPYQLPQAADVTIRIYKVTGRLIHTLSLGHQEAGFYRNRSNAAYWNGRNDMGEKVSSGIYFYNIRISPIGSSGGNFTATRRMLLVK